MVKSDPSLLLWQLMSRILVHSWKFLSGGAVLVRGVMRGSFLLTWKGL